MDANKSSKLKLALMGAVLVFVALGATFAWFASNSMARVNNIDVSLESHTQAAGLDGGVEQHGVDDWDPYNQEQLSFIPGQRYDFRVKYNCTSGTLKLIVQSDDKSALQRLKFCAVSGQNAMYTIQSDPTTWSDLTLTNNEATIASGLSGFGQYCYYSFYMPGNVGNTYQNVTDETNSPCTFSFTLGGSFN